MWKNTDIIEIIQDKTIEQLIDIYILESSEFIKYGYNEYRTKYILYFKKRKDWLRIIWNLYIKAFLYKPFYNSFLYFLPPAFYSEEDQEPTFEYAIKNMKDNIDKIKKAREMLADFKSKEVINNLLFYRLTGNKNILFNSYDKVEKMYFDKEILPLKEKIDLFVDCGGYVGDSAIQFLSYIPKYNKIIVYEPDTNNYKKAVKNTKKYRNIKVYNYGIGKENMNCELVGNGVGSHLVNSSDKIGLCKLVSLDSHINTSIDFIKMDIEGYELDALIGAKEHIKKDRPILAISIYHKISDLYIIQLFVNEIVDNYKYYVRHYGNTISEVVLYCIPVDVS